MADFEDFLLGVGRHPADSLPLSLTGALFLVNWTRVWTQLLLFLATTLQQLRRSRLVLRAGLGAMGQ